MSTEEELAAKPAQAEDPAGPGREDAVDAEDAVRSDDASDDREPAPAAGAPWRAGGQVLAAARKTYRRNAREAWERFGFAVTLALGVALLTSFGANALGKPHPAALGFRFGAWALVAGLGLALLIQARAQLLRALDHS
jgi:hypothetical protein